MLSTFWQRADLSIEKRKGVKMDIFDTVKTMLAVRGYKADPIPGEIVSRIVEAGRLTASAMNRQHWGFVVPILPRLPWLLPWRCPTRFWAISTVPERSRI